MKWKAWVTRQNWREKMEIHARRILHRRMAQKSKREKKPGTGTRRRDSDVAEKECGEGMPSRKRRLNSVTATLHGATPSGSSLLNDARKIFTGCGRWGLSGSDTVEGWTRLPWNVVARIISIFTTLLFGQAPGGRGERYHGVTPSLPRRHRWTGSAREAENLMQSYVCVCVYFCPKRRRVSSPRLLVSERRVVERFAGNMFR